MTNKVETWMFANPEFVPVGLKITRRKGKISLLRAREIAVELLGYGDWKKR